MTLGPLNEMHKGDGEKRDKNAWNDDVAGKHMVDEQLIWTVRSLEEIDG